MKKKLERYWKNSLTTLLCTWSLLVHAQMDTSDAYTTQEVTEIKEWDFHQDLVPAQSIYGRSWNDKNIDSPAYDYEMMKAGYLLNLTEDDCGYVHPVCGEVTSRYGWRGGRWHKGIDVKLNSGDSVYAAFDGVVRIKKYDPSGFGNYVMIRHYNGLETLYAHLSETLVDRNHTVRAGQIIGLGGSTGRSTGAHLHFQTMLMGQAFDPRKIIDFDTYVLLDSQTFVNHTWFPYINGKDTRTAAAPAGALRYHRIKKGDTLYGIASRYGTSVNSICRLNRISRKSILRVGRNLRVR